MAAPKPTWTADPVAALYAALFTGVLSASSKPLAILGTVARLDLGRWLANIKAVEGNVERNATDPRLLVALWVYATLDGIGSARELARLCTKHLAYSVAVRRRERQLSHAL